MTPVSKRERRYATFHDWRWQLFRACQEDRLEDVAAIGAGRRPGWVAVAQVTEVTEVRDSPIFFHRSTTSRESVRLIPVQEMNAVARAEAISRPLGPLPLLSRTLLREPHEFQGPSLFWARSVACMEILLGAGARLEDLGWMGLPLMVAVARLGDLALLRYLVDDHGQDPNARREQGGYTALHWARGRDVVEFLVARGADTGAVNAFGDSVIAQLVRYGQLEAVEYLFSLPPERINTANAFNWLQDVADPWATIVTLVRGGVSPHAVLPPLFGERHGTLVLHALLRRGIHELAAADAAGRPQLADRLVATVGMILDAGFDARRRDGSNQLAYHILLDHQQVLAAPVFAALSRLLQRFDGPRQPPPPDVPSCTCGLNL